MDDKLSKQLDIIIESKIGDLWSGLPPEVKKGIIVGGVVTGVSVGIPELVKGIHSFFKLFREKCKRRCESLRGEKQYNLCYHNCRKVGIKQSIRHLASVRTKCKDDKCKKKINQEITMWNNKLIEIEKLVKRV